MSVKSKTRPRPFCSCCGELNHNFKTDEDAINCIPPRDTTDFGPHYLSKRYKEYLFQNYPSLTASQIVQSWLGLNEGVFGYQTYYNAATHIDGMLTNADKIDWILGVYNYNYMGHYPV